MKKRLLCLLLALSMVLGYFPGAVAASAEEPVSKTTDFITSSVDIDALLERDYIDNVPLGYNENIFSLYQPGWGFD